MSTPARLTAGKYFIDVPKDVEPEELLDLTVYIQIKIGTKYLFSDPVIVGDKMRIFYDVDKHNFNPIRWEDYKEMVDNDSDTE